MDFLNELLYEILFIVGLILFSIFAYYMGNMEHTALKKELLKEYPFICPLCGAKFHAKYHQVMFKFPISPLKEKRAKLKCPNCKKVSKCLWSSHDDKKD